MRRFGKIVFSHSHWAYKIINRLFNQYKSTNGGSSISEQRTGYTFQGLTLSTQT
jgi:hypothetical protein